MRGEKKIRAALPHLTERELWLLEFDCHRAADAAAIGGATEAQWQEYVTLENDVAAERRKRFPDSYCPFPGARVIGWSEKEYDELQKLHERIRKGKTISGNDAGSKKGDQTDE